MARWASGPRSVRDPSETRPQRAWGCTSSANILCAAQEPDKAKAGLHEIWMAPHARGGDQRLRMPFRQDLRRGEVSEGRREALIWSPKNGRHEAW